MRFTVNSKDKMVNISTFLLKNSALAFFKWCRNLSAKKARRDISTTISTKFRIIIPASLPERTANFTWFS